MKVSIIIPVYNEFRTFNQVMERVLNAPLPEGCSKEVVVVDDGSTDGTTRMLRDYPRSGVVVAHHSILNFGKGTAVRIGLTLASGDIVLIQDGDLEYDPNDYSKILEPIIKGDADIVYGSRFLGKPKGMAFKNLLANRILTVASNLLYGARITDEATAYKAFRASIMREMSLECKRFEFCPEVTAKVRRLGHRIHEVAISYNARNKEEGKKIKARDGFEALWTLIRYRFTPQQRLLNLKPVRTFDAGATR
jgi:glycosyltransferase involved in cell wall biosynthesis